MPDTAIPVSDTSLRAYVNVPTVGSGPWPGVVVIHDAFGLTDITRDHADRLAAAGYVAVAPDLYSRGGLVRCVQATFRSLMAGRGRAFDDIQSVRRWVAGRDDTSDKVGVIGFCMGGGFVLATASSGFAAAAPNYGLLPKDLDAVLSQACPIVASFGKRDRGLQGAAATLERALSEGGIPHDVKEYPEAGHSFLDRFNSGPLAPLMRIGGIGYHHPSAEDAWGRILQFFARHLA
jgi:carboxymethylenebutenolidase